MLTLKTDNLINKITQGKTINILVSVYDKTHLADFLKELNSALKFNIIATGGTYKHLNDNDFSCTEVSTLTNFPEILDGRVKTLHPVIFGGILARDLETDKIVLKENNIPEIDMVIVNLYPFIEKAKANLSLKEMQEYIDIGGVSLLRAAAKNYENVLVVSSPSQYDEILNELKNKQSDKLNTLRTRLAMEAFKSTSYYDSRIAEFYDTDNKNIHSASMEIELLSLNTNEGMKLRYGENPHQEAFYLPRNKNYRYNFPPFKQLNGKELSANNIIDLYSVINILTQIRNEAVCIVKHNNPCGVASSNNLYDAYIQAYNTDPESAFGGVYGFTSTVDEKIANAIIENFVELVIAPDFTDAALKILATKKNLRVLLTDNLNIRNDGKHWVIRDLGNFGFILQRNTQDVLTYEDFKLVCGEALTKAEIDDVKFAWGVVQNLTSNAILIAKNENAIGFGIGQTSRIKSVKIALAQASNNSTGAILASDGFFPNVDNIEMAKANGIKVIVQPGGSIKDEDVIKACKEASIKMLFTNQRFFKH